MPRVLGGRWIGWARLGAALLALSACQGESNTDDEDGDDDDPNGYCERVAGAFVRCEMGALLVELSECEEPEDEEGRCTATCVATASCEELRPAICSDARPPELDACLDGCLPPPFTCGSGDSVPESFLCDGFPDCFDGSDEGGDCPTCSDGSLLPTDWVCDGFPDCTDGLDEAGCPTFTCESGEMVPAFFECDYFHDCADGSDEHAGCPDTFVCANGDLVPAEWECDDEPDCLDGSDEHSGCPSVTCGDGTTARGERCDGTFDCLDASDEPTSCPPTPLEEACGTG